MAQTTTIRPAGPGKMPPKRHVRTYPRSTLASMATLARWQLRQTGRLLVLIGLGLLAAVVLVCAIPLYVQVSLSAGLRHTLAADPQNLFLTAQAQGTRFDAQTIEDVQTSLDGIVQGDMGNTISVPSDLSIQVPGLPVNKQVSISAVGMDAQQASAHAKLLQGRLPAVSSGDTIEFVTTAQNQLYLGVHLNQTFTLPFQLISGLTPKPIVIKVKFRLVGIIAPPDTNDVFWHGESLVTSSSSQGLGTLEQVPVLVSNSQLIDVLEQIFSSPTAAFARLSAPFNIYWYYNFNFANVDINHLSDLSTALNSALTNISGYSAPNMAPAVMNLAATGPLDILQSYGERVTVLNLPTSCLAYLIAGLLLFFVLLLTELLIERQMETIALLRSRGATRPQVFTALLVQSVLLDVLALLAGPLLAIVSVIGLAHLTLASSDQGALSLLTTNPLQTARGQLARDLIVVGAALLGTVFAIWRVLRLNMLALRRESARSTQRPFWLRLRLDLLAAVVALAGFGFTLYIGSPGVLDARTRTLILPLTSLVGVLCLLLGCLLLFLRLFPGLLRQGERLAARNRGAAPVLAMAQMARSPRHALRLTLLFALAVAFALFTLIFAQTQAQRLSDMTVYQVGSDFSGTIPQTLQDDDWNSQMAYYRGIKGVTSVTLGTSVPMAGGSNKNVAIDLEAVDSSTYASTIYWPAQNSSQSLSALLAPLHAGQETSAKSAIPAIIDDAAAQSLGIGMGQQFVLANYNGPITLVVTGIVHYLPTVYDSANAVGSNGDAAQGGVLIDFQTYSTIEMETNLNGVGTQASKVWLRASSRPADLTNVRGALFSGTYALENGEDQRVLAQNLTTDPLYRTIVGILALGALIALLLGLIGNLLVAWWNARSRRTSFALLRALGCAPGQIARVLLWEQGIVYGAGLVLGVLLSIIFSLVILPSFIFSPISDAGSAQAFYVAQSVPAVRVVLPAWPIFGVLAGLVIVCVLALLLMLRIVIRPQVSQTLRLDED